MKFSAAKGDISTYTLVAIVIGIIVLVVVIYLMVFYSKESSFDCRLCLSKFAEWCQKCLTDRTNWDATLESGNWPNDVPKSEDLKNCLKACTNIDPNSVCNALKSECKKYIYIPKPTTTA